MKHIIYVSLPWSDGILHEDTRLQEEMCSKLDNAEVTIAGSVRYFLLSVLCWRARQLARSAAESDQLSSSLAATRVEVRAARDIARRQIRAHLCGTCSDLPNERSCAVPKYEIEVSNQLFCVRSKHQGRDSALKRSHL